MHETGEIRIVEIAHRLPAGLDALASEARGEGWRHIDRLISEWACGAECFDRPGEVLLAAFIADELAAVGGLTVEPRLNRAFRMRRLYVRPSLRRQGIGRLLAQALIEHAAGSAEALTVNAGDAAAVRFWEKLGFAIACGASHGSGSDFMVLPRSSVKPATRAPGLPAPSRRDKASR